MLCMLMLYHSFIFSKMISQPLFVVHTHNKFYFSKDMITFLRIVPTAFLNKYNLNARVD